ncbi:hypothetical protein [Microbacterium sp. ZW T5_56]|uniref:hypothetical protein n=1 Tax=Microbacterium sp. ZW T5_56 TaxID=3378081 RepID=UPI00385197BA
MSTPSTLRDHLSSVGITVSPTQFEQSRALPSRQGGSWALWGATTDDLSIFDDAATVAPRLRTDVVLIGANFGLGGDAGPFRPFQNFHASTSRGDSKLRRAIGGSPLEGAYLTDLVKDYPSKYATRLPREVRSGSLDLDAHVISGFQAEQDALGIGPSTLYIPIGARTRELWDLLVDREAIPAAQRVFHHEYGGAPLFRGKPVQNLTHYAAAVNLAEAVTALLDQQHRG